MIKQLPWIVVYKSTFKPEKISTKLGGTHDAIVIIIVNWHRTSSSNPGWGCLHFTLP